MTTGTNDLERRVLDQQDAELRLHEGGDGPRLEGYAAVFNSESRDLGDFREVFLPGAFEDALEDSDVRGLFNHNRDHVLGREANGTLRLTADQRGLHYSVDLPDTPTAKEVRALVARRDITGSSLSFSVPDGGDTFQSRGGDMVRFVERVSRVGDVGPVTFPAYEATEVSARSLERARKEKARKRPSRPPPELAFYEDRDAALVTAVHEAGHAVWHLCQGRSVVDLEVRTTWDEDGNARVDGGVCRPVCKARRPEGCFAGFAAEKLLGHRPSFRDNGFNGDIERARELVSGRLNKRELVRRAEEVLRPHQRAVGEIAEELAERGELSGSRVKGIFRRYRGKQGDGSSRERPKPRWRDRIVVPDVSDRVGRGTKKTGRSKPRSAWPARRR